MNATRTWLQVFTLTLLLGAATHTACAAQATSRFGDYHPARPYPEQVSQTLYLPMRDGVRLALRITRPAQNGKAVEQRLPVIWHHTLGVEQQSKVDAVPAEAGLRDVPSLTAYGYVVVQVARRGNGQSFGVRRGYNDRTESDDAYEITEWLAKQAWSTGAVGVYGCSNTGDAAMHVMESRPPHLKAVFAGCFSWSKYDAMRRGGIFAQWGTGPQRTVEQDVAIDPVDGDASKTLLRQAAEEHQQSTVLYDMWKGLPYRDSWSPLVASRFWAEGSASSFADQLRQNAVPLYIEGGWHDELRDQGIIALLNIPGSRILIGPWTHCMNPGFELLQEMHRYFDTYLKQIDTGLAKEPRVHYFTMTGASGGEWHTAASWPVADVKPQRLFLSGTGDLAERSGAPVSKTFAVSVGKACNGVGTGPFMQPCHTAGEGASFTGPPLARALEVTGNPVANLQISADRTDANVFAYLEDVAPDGSVTMVTEGRLRASLRALATPAFVVPGTPWHRSYKEDAQPLVAGAAAQLEFDLMPTSYVFAAGHRVQLTLMGADWRERDRDPALDGVRISVLGDATQASFLDLPVRAAAHGG